MAIMKNIFLAASVLATLTSAVPMPNIDKRAVVMNTVTHTTWTTVDVTTTVYVNDAAPTPPPQAPSVATPSVPTPPAAAPEPPSASVPSVSAGAFAQESPSSPPAPVYTPPVASPVASSPAAAAPAPASTVDVTPKAPQSGSTGGPCQGEGAACTGDITFYNGGGGYGACGSIIDDSAMTLALPVGLMGSQSNGNPFCGKTISIKGTDGSIHQGTVNDKCMGCEGDSIDLTPALFQAVAPGGDGRVHGIEWYFN